MSSTAAVSNPLTFLLAALLFGAVFIAVLCGIGLEVKNTRAEILAHAVVSASSTSSSQAPSSSSSTSPSSSQAPSSSTSSS